MFLQEPGRDAKDELKSPSSFLCNLLNCGYFRNPEVRKTNLAAAEIPAVVLQPGVGIQISRVENRNPVAILEAACPNENHKHKIGEDLVKIKTNTCRWELGIDRIPAMTTAQFQAAELIDLPRRRDVPFDNFRVCHIGYQV